MSSFDDYIAGQHDRFIDDLRSFVRQPSVAATGDGITAMADRVRRRLEQIGATPQWIATAGSPIIYAELAAARAR